MQTEAAGQSARGVTLPEVLIAVTIAGTLTAISLTGIRGHAEGIAMRAAERAVRGQLVLARTVAVARRETVRVRADETGDLVILDGSGARLNSAGIGGATGLGVDSMRVRPSTLRFNSRGQGAPGSVYLYRGNRTVRIVSNFLGRLRTERNRIR